jgi:hypothetical protein
MLNHRNHTAPVYQTNQTHTAEPHLTEPNLICPVQRTRLRVKVRVAAGAAQGRNHSHNYHPTLPQKNQRTTVGKLLTENIQSRPLWKTHPFCEYPSKNYVTDQNFETGFISPGLILRMT